MARKRSDRPNVIVFFTDQQRWDSSGLHGNPLGLTPTFDHFAQEGTHCFNAFTCQPVCAPARSTLQTGFYPTRTTVHRNGVSLPDGMPTMARYFNQAGYRTGYIGKWHLADCDPVPRHQQGEYDDWLGANLTEFVSRPYDCVLYDNDGQEKKLPGYRVDATADAAIRYVEDHQDEPFYLFLSFLEPHHQNHIDDYVAPDGYRERYTGAWVPPDLAALGGSAHKHLGGYWGIIKRIDEALARMMDALKSLGLDEDTIVMYTSDHGSHFKTRNSEYKRCCHESAIRVPTALWGPGFNGGGRIRDLVSLVDLPPTLLDAAGIEVPEAMQGRSIMPLLDGDNADWPEEVFVQISEAQVGRAVRTHRWKYSVVAPDADVRNDPDAERYVEEFLYDLEADPYELTNLIDQQSHAKVAEVMRQRLLRRMVEAGEDAPTIERVARVPSGQRIVTDEETLL